MYPGGSAGLNQLGFPPHFIPVLFLSLSFSFPPPFFPLSPSLPRPVCMFPHCFTTSYKASGNRKYYNTLNIGHRLKDKYFYAFCMIVTHLLGDQ